jgi:hypothetical protein
MNTFSSEKKNLLNNKARVRAVLFEVMKKILDKTFFSCYNNNRFRKETEK